MRAGRATAIAAAISCLATGEAAATEAAAAPEGVGGAAAGAGFELRRSVVKPKRPLFDGPKRIRLHYGFGAPGPVDLEIRVVAIGSGNTVRVWRERGARPGRRQQRRWDGLNRRGKAAPDGRYRFKLGPAGGRLHNAATMRLRGHVHPVDGPRGDRGGVGQFGAGRNDGRTHEGYDVLTPCGTPLLAARGGRVTEAGFHARLYGHFIRINARKSGEQYFYSHLIAPARLDARDRVRTGEVVGAVGQTGNAASTPCHLHFELREHGRLVDPKPHLAAWDR